MTIRSLVILGLIFLLSMAGISQSKSKIQINIQYYPDSALLMTSYYGDRIILTDTAYAGYPGVFEFENDELLPGGIYMAVSPSKRKLFEFIAGDDQDFSLTTDTINYSTRMFVKGSEENDLFFDYMKFNDQLYRANKEISDLLAIAGEGTERQAYLSAKIDSLNQATGEYKMEIIRENNND